LQDLRRQRNNADYDLRRPCYQADAQREVRRAAAQIKILDAVVEPTRTQVMNAIRDYERIALRDVTWHP
jgi:hypothetical protein